MGVCPTREPRGLLLGSALGHGVRQVVVELRIRTPHATQETWMDRALGDALVALLAALAHQEGDTIQPQIKAEMKRARKEGRPPHSCREIISHRASRRQSLLDRSPSGPKSSPQRGLPRLPGRYRVRSVVTNSNPQERQNWAVVIGSTIKHSSATVRSPSVVRQADCTLCRAARPRLTFSRMSEAVAVQMKGVGCPLCWAM